MSVVLVEPQIAYCPLNVEVSDKLFLDTHIKEYLASQVGVYSFPQSVHAEACMTGVMELPWQRRKKTLLLNGGRNIFYFEPMGVIHSYCGGSGVWYAKKFPFNSYQHTKMVRVFVPVTG